MQPWPDVRGAPAVGQGEGRVAAQLARGEHELESSLTEHLAVLPREQSDEVVGPVLDGVGELVQHLGPQLAVPAPVGALQCVAGGRDGLRALAPVGVGKAAEDVTRRRVPRLGRKRGVDEQTVDELLS